MNAWLIIIISLILILILSILNKKLDNKNKNISFPYSKKNILTKEEYAFYLILKQVTTKHKNLICPKVGLKDIAYVTNNGQYFKYFNKISQKHVDFLICDDELKILFAIELDDKSHEKDKAKSNDIFKNNFFEKIGIPLIRIKTGKYTIENIEKATYHRSTLQLPS